MRFSKKGLFASLCCVLATYSSQPLLATTFGTYDARALAMGGAAVAAGDTSQAQFYNPALLSFKNEDEDRSRNGRTVFPHFAALVSDAAKTTGELVSDDLAGRVTDSIDAYNMSPDDPAIRQQALNSIIDFDNVVDSINSQNVTFEGFLGLSVSEPANREGGSFYFGSRAIILGLADVSTEDQILTDRYINVLELLVAGEEPSDMDRADLFDGDNLRDPRPQLTSSANIASLDIREWGLAVSKELPIYGVPIAFGVTPKFMQVKSYRESLTFSDDVPSYQDNLTSKLTANVDLGVAIALFNRFRAGISVKDIIAKTFVTQSDLEVVIKPKARLGFAYLSDKLTVGWDIDITQNQLTLDGPKTQETSLGMEYRPINHLGLRLGYRQFSEGNRFNIFSAGVGYQFSRISLQASFAGGKDTKGAALEFGWAF